MTAAQACMEHPGIWMLPARVTDYLYLVAYASDRCIPMVVVQVKLMCYLQRLHAACLRMSGAYASQYVEDRERQT